jgi:PAS domain S-box-containing protein
MTDVSHDPGSDLRATIETLYTRVLELIFDPETGALRDREAAEQIISIGQRLLRMDRQALLGLQIFDVDSATDAAGTPPRALRIESEELLILRGIADAAGHGFMVADLHGNVIYANPAMVRLLGLPGLKALEGKHLSKYYPEATQRAFEENIIPAIVDKGRWVGELDMRSATGASIATMHSLFLLHGEVGRAPYIGGLVFDIRPQKATIEALRSSEENFRALVENANDGILIATAAGEHVYANARAAEMTGYTVAELLRIPMVQLAHPDEVERVARILRHRIDSGTGPRTYATRVVRKDGRVVHVEVTGARTRWQGQPADIVMLRDITRRREIEQALRESEERYSLVVEEGCDGVAIAQDEVIIYASRPLGKILGFKPEELVGRHFYDLIPPEEREASRARYRARLESDSMPLYGRFSLLLRNGTVRRFDFYGARIHYRGRPALMGIIRAPVSGGEPEGGSPGAGENREGA